MSKYWVSSGDKIHGPFDSAQLKSLAAKGSLKPTHRISTDKERWVAAATVRGLKFQVEKVVASGSESGPQSEDKAKVAHSANIPTSTTTQGQESSSPFAHRLGESKTWFALVSGQQFGPVPGSKLEQLASAGTLTARDHVRPAASQDWVPAGHVTELVAASQPSNQMAAELVLIPRRGVMAQFIDGLIRGIGFVVLQWVPAILLGHDSHWQGLPVVAYALLSVVIVVMSFVAAKNSWSDKALQKVKSGEFQIVTRSHSFSKTKADITKLSGVTHIRLGLSGERQSIGLTSEMKVDGDGWEYCDSHYPILSTEDDEVFRDTRKALEQFTGLPTYRARDL